MIFSPFTLTDVHIILKESAGRPNPDGRGHGHGIEKHARIGRNALMDRMRFEPANVGDMPVYTSFCTLSDMAAAVHEALTAPENAGEINTFYRDVKPRLALVQRLRNPVQIRVATGGGSLTRWDSFVSLVALQMKGAYRGMHMVRAVPQFTPGTLGRDRPNG